MIVWNGRLPPPISLGWPATSEKPTPRFCRLMPVARDDDAGAEAHVVGLDQRHDHAVLVRGAEVDGAAARRIAGSEVLGTPGIDQPRARCEVSNW